MFAFMTSFFFVVVFFACFSHAHTTVEFALASVVEPLRSIRTFKLFHICISPFYTFRYMPLKVSRGLIALNPELE